jgi:hypothetical protein
LYAHPQETDRHSAILFLIYRLQIQPLTGTTASQVATIYGRIFAIPLTFIPFLLLGDAISTSITPSQSGKYLLPETEDHKLAMASYLTCFYFFFGWAQHLPQLFLLRKPLETELDVISVQSFALQAMTMITLGTSLGIRGMKFASSHANQMLGFAMIWNLFYFIATACEAWVLGGGQAIILLLLWKRGLMIRHDMEFGHGDAVAIDENLVDEQTALLPGNTTSGLE